MLQNYNIWKVLQVFLDNPLVEGGLQLREISRKIKLAPPSVKKYLQNLENQSLIIKGKSRVQGFPIYKANRDNQKFKLYKKIDLIIKIEEINLIAKIEERCMPDTIVLFGSASKGEDIQTSDVDIYVQSSEKKINLETYEKHLNRKINLFFEENFLKLSKELKNNIINGIKLSGYLKIY